MSGYILYDTASYKTELLSTLTGSADICELLLNSSTYTADDVNNLMYTQVFPYLYSDESQTDVLPYLCIEVDITKAPTNTVKDMQLTIWAYCHKDDMKYSKEGYFGTKADILSDMVERSLRESNKSGIETLKLQSVTNLSPNEKYYGKQLIYTIPHLKIGR